MILLVMYDSLSKHTGPAQRHRGCRALRIIIGRKSGFVFQGLLEGVVLVLSVTPLGQAGGFRLQVRILQTRTTGTGIEVLSATRKRKEVSKALPIGPPSSNPA